MLKRNTIHFVGQVYIPRNHIKDEGVIHNASEFIPKAQVLGYHLEDVRIDRMKFSKELEGRLLYRVSFNLVEQKGKFPSVTDIDTLFAKLNCKYKGKIVKFQFD